MRPGTPDFGWSLGGDADFAEASPATGGRPVGRPQWPAVEYGRVAGVYDPRAYLWALRAPRLGQWITSVLEGVPQRGKLAEALWCWGVHPELRGRFRPAGLHGVAALCLDMGEALGMSETWMYAADELEQLTRDRSKKLRSPRDFVSRKE